MDWNDCFPTLYFYNVNTALGFTTFQWLRFSPHSTCFQCSLMSGVLLTLFNLHFNDWSSSRALRFFQHYSCNILMTQVLTTLWKQLAVNYFQFSMIQFIDYVNSNTKMFPVWAVLDKPQWQDRCLETPECSCQTDTVPLWRVMWAEFQWGKVSGNLPSYWTEAILLWAMWEKCQWKDR